MSIRTRRAVQELTSPPALDLVPLVDLTFQILIFFICCSKFKEAEGTISAYLPLATGTRPTQEDPTQLQPIEIRMENRKNLDAEGNVFALNGNETVSSYYWGGEFEGCGTKGLDRLAAIVASLSEEDRSKKRICLDPEEETSLWDVIQVMNICRIRGLRNVSFKDRSTALPRTRH